MKHLLRSTFAAVPVLLLAVGCGKKNDTAATPTPASNPSAATAAASAPTSAPQARVIEVQATDAMKFSVTRIEAAPGEELQIKLVNVGTLPKEAMGHNLVLLKKEVNPQTYANAAMTAKATDYLPPDLKDQVLAATKLLGPKQIDTITFKAPQEPGEYPYICSFPAHFIAGMKGVLVVK
jgi:azurin